jgi:hypothetical protein
MEKLNVVHFPYVCVLPFNIQYCNVLHEEQ